MGASDAPGRIDSHLRVDWGSKGRWFKSSRPDPTFGSQLRAAPCSIPARTEIPVHVQTRAERSPKCIRERRRWVGLKFAWNRHEDRPVKARPLAADQVEDLGTASPRIEIKMTRSPRRTLPRRTLAWAAVSVALVSLAFRAQPAAADIGVWSVSDTSGESGESVDLLIACGGCVPGIPGGALVGPRLPVSLLPLRNSLYRRQCPSGLCTPTAPAPPAAPPYLPLGVAQPLQGDERAPETAVRLGIPIPRTVRDHGESAIREWLANMNRLRFQVPDATPGPYKFVIYCRGCAKGPEGSLIQVPSTTPRQRALLRRRYDEEVFRIMSSGVHRAGGGTGGTPRDPRQRIATAIVVVGVVVARRFAASGTARNR